MDFSGERGGALGRGSSSLEEAWVMSGVLVQFRARGACPAFSPFSSSVFSWFLPCSSIKSKFSLEPFADRTFESFESALEFLLPSLASLGGLSEDGRGGGGLGEDFGEDDSSLQ